MIEEESNRRIRRSRHFIEKAFGMIGAILL
jgi:hypothetical protein